MAPAPSQSNTDEHWKKTTRLMLIHLGVWFFFGYVIHMFVNPLNTSSFQCSASRSASTWPRRAR